MQAQILSMDLNPAFMFISMGLWPLKRYESVIGIYGLSYFRNAFGNITKKKDVPTFRDLGSRFRDFENPHFHRWDFKFS